MKKHGFTLVEMLGILVVLSIIVVISVPAITSSLKKADQQRYDDWLDSLYIAAEENIPSPSGKTERPSLPRSALVQNSPRR